MISFKKIDIEFVVGKLPVLHEIFDKYSNEITAAYLFGSLHSGNISPLSDVDIAILFKENMNEQTANQLENKIYEDLSSYLGTDEIDLIILNNAPLSVRYGVLKNSRVLFCGEKNSKMDFENIVILEYLDFKPYKEEFDREFLRLIY